MKRMEAQIFGLVQGVGFRFFVCHRARQLGLLGFVRNLSDSTVEIIAEGDELQLEALVESMETGSSGARISKIQKKFVAPSNSFSDFEIEYS